MEKWGLAICVLGFFRIMYASTTTPANLLMVFSGIFYVVVGGFLIYYKSRKIKKEKRGN
jgi:hypothetical protein